MNQNKEIRLRLEDPSRQDKDLGELILIVVLWPKTQEDKEQVLLHCMFSFYHIYFSFIVTFFFQ